ncbi:lytic transglycosylase domain-containing protein [Kineococcus gynurae]
MVRQPRGLKRGPGRSDHHEVMTSRRLRRPGTGPVGSAGTGRVLVRGGLLASVLVATLLAPAPADAVAPPAPPSAAATSSGTPAGVPTATPTTATPTTAAEARAAATEARAAADRAARAAADLDVQLAAGRRAVEEAVSLDVDATLSLDGRLRARSQATRDSARQVRRLYMAGAGGALRDSALGAVLAGSDPLGEASARAVVQRSALRRDQETTAAAERSLTEARGAADAAEAEALARISALRETAAAASTLADDLAAARARAAELDGLGTRLAADERVARERAAAAQALARAEAAADRSQRAAAGSVAGVGVRAVPADYAALYAAAAPTCPGMRRQLLSAVGQVESGHGRTVGPSSAGARGPMQFMPATFAAYAVDGDGDGRTDVQDPADAVFTAAAYLCANGAGTGRDGEARALFRYNHADWYVQLVQRIADGTP